MATATKICKVCGVEYEYCHTTRRVAGVFRYQDVACGPEHGSQYLAAVLASRGEDEPETASRQITFDDLLSEEIRGEEFVEESKEDALD